MISRKRFNKERLLSGTLLETLLLFLFILLAITSIYEKKNRELMMALEESNLLGPNEVPIDSTDLISLRTKSDIYDNLNDANKENLEKVKNFEEQVEKYKDLINSKGVMPPPCVLADNNQTLFEVDYGPNYTYLLKVVNLENPLKIGDGILKNGNRHILTQKQFNKLGFSLHESQRIDPNDKNCDISVKGAYSSANCYHCVYVVDVVDHSIDPYFNKAFTSLNIGKEETKIMQRKLQDYFMIR